MWYLTWHCLFSLLGDQRRDPPILLDGPLHRRDIPRIYAPCIHTTKCHRLCLRAHESFRYGKACANLILVAHTHMLYKCGNNVVKIAVGLMYIYIFVAQFHVLLLILFLFANLENLSHIVVTIALPKQLWKQIYWIGFPHFQ